MGFSENILNLRKQNALNRQQLAGMLGVTEKDILKWEAGDEYPDAEKIMEICELFKCSSDALLKDAVPNRVSAAEIQKFKGAYEKLFNGFSKAMAFGVGLILLGVTALLFFAEAGNKYAEHKEAFGIAGVIVLLAFVMASVFIFIYFGAKVENFHKKNSIIPNFYSEDELDKFNSKYPAAIAVSVAVIILGVILLIAFYGFIDDFADSAIPAAILLACITLAVPVMVYYGIQHEKYDTEYYNRNHIHRKRNELCGKICGAIMLAATAVFLVWGFVSQNWEICWLPFPVGAILCGIISTFMKKD